VKSSKTLKPVKGKSSTSKCEKSFEEESQYRLDVTVLPIDGNEKPFFKKLILKSNYLSISVFRQ
jgi:hypothetical protein